MIVLGLAAAQLGCASDAATSDTHSPPASLVADSSGPSSLSTLAPIGAMSVDPESVAPGDTISVSYESPLREKRGAFFFLVDQDERKVAGLWTGQLEGVDGPGYVDDVDSFAILDVPVIVPGPDQLVIPPNVPGGSYHVCTANSRPAACLSITVSDP